VMLRPGASVGGPLEWLCPVMTYRSASPERDSPRDQVVVTLFLLTVFGLLLGAGIKSRMEKAGLDTSIAWSTGRKWWEVSPSAELHILSISDRQQEWMPRRHVEGFGLGDRAFIRSRERNSRGRDYIGIPESPTS
jgi:hypothetical protein